MTQPNNGTWSNSPWLGESAVGQWQLWHAGCEWAAKSNWFAGTAVEPASNPEEPALDLHKVGESGADY